MTDDLTRLIGAVAPDDIAPLADLEDAVWTRISEHRDRVRLDRVRVAMVALALVVGFTNGGLMLLAPPPEPSEMRIFTVAAGLSPLSRLDVRG